MGDIVAIEKLLSIKGHNAFYEGVRNISRGDTIYYIPFALPDEPGKPRRSWSLLDLRTHNDFIDVADRLERLPTAMQKKNLAFDEGITGLPALRRVGSLDFARSFPWNIMHLFFENIVKNLVNLWKGNFKSLEIQVGRSPPACVVLIKNSKTVEPKKEKKEIWLLRSDYGTGVKLKAPVFPSITPILHPVIHGVQTAAGWTQREAEPASPSLARRDDGGLRWEEGMFILSFRISFPESPEIFQLPLVIMTFSPGWNLHTSLTRRDYAGQYPYRPSTYRAARKARPNFTRAPSCGAFLGPRKAGFVLRAPISEFSTLGATNTHAGTGLSIDRNNCGKGRDENDSFELHDGRRSGPASIVPRGLARIVPNGLITPAQTAFQHRIEYMKQAVTY
ncbi:hypothetical protein C8J57DRAFT_1258073 [Mycena rebaudengoi]|nr:hypothetical protein C8J57DRAFT_1258073 [Mycena rebaudengoi]